MGLVDLLLPERCVGCRRADVAICEACRARLTLLREPLCARCGERLAAIVQTKLQAPCPTCEVTPIARGDARAESRASQLRRAS